MVESEAKELPEDAMLAGVMFGHESISQLMQSMNLYVKLILQFGNIHHQLKTKQLKHKIKKEIAYNDLRSI